MSDKRLTAVSWLQEQFHKVPFSQFGNLFEQAKALEREQQKEIAIDCFNAGYREAEGNAHKSTAEGDISEFADANIYYQKNYGSKSDYFTKTYGDESRPK